MPSWSSAVPGYESTEPEAHAGDRKKPPLASGGGRANSRAFVMSTAVKIYDTTLRDGTQGEGISFSVADKLLIALLAAVVGGLVGGLLTALAM